MTDDSPDSARPATASPGDVDTDRVGHPPRLKYSSTATGNSTYGRAARLIERHGSAGLVIDLGCGPGTFAEPLAELGFDYLGVDTDQDALAAATELGRQVLDRDLSDLDATLADVSSAIDGRSVAAVALLDVIEHLPDPEHVTEALGRFVDSLASGDRAPLLVVSIPNVSHVELGAKLIMGRWDLTEVGLLDSTHITLFTEQRVNRLMSAAGFVELGADDNIYDRTEQQFPPDHPGVTPTTTLSQFLRSVRRDSGPADQTYQFVRCYRRATAAEQQAARSALVPAPTGRPDDPHAHHPGPFLSVIVRTRGNRPSLIDTLTALAAQTDDDVEILLMVHHPDQQVVEQMRSVVSLFAPAFANRVRVNHVPSGGRSRPLNTALERATGRYLAILDDDDVVTADWVACFRRGTGDGAGTIVRAPCVMQATERDARTGVATAVSGFDAPYPARFDYLDHIRQNRSPSCSYAVPRATVEAFGIRFDETLEVCEDWKFLMAVARWSGVTDADTAVDSPSPDHPPELLATSIYRRARNGDGADHTVDTETWISDHVAVAVAMAAEPSLIPAGATLRIRQLYETLEAGGVLPVGRPDGSPGMVHPEIAARDETITALRNRIDALERSRVWQLTRPLRPLAAIARRSRSTVRRLRHP